MFPPHEEKLIRERLGREPNEVEKAMLEVMWSEHASYKSSRPFLKLLPTENEHVVLGPGEDAGIVEFDDETWIVVGIESHNHPSAIEPTAVPPPVSAGSSGIYSAWELARWRSLTPYASGRLRRRETATSSRAS